MTEVIYKCADYFQDWSNPHVRPHIHIYPEIPDGPISEVWHTKKWHTGLDLSMLTPMFDAGDRHYYVNEVARLASGALVVPSRWVIYKGELHADVHRISIDSLVRHLSTVAISQTS